MDLILKDAGAAAVYGVPDRNVEAEAVIADLIKRGWSERAARRHLAYAIAAGAYVENVDISAEMLAMADPQKEVR